MTVGIAVDGPWERNDEARAEFEREISDLLNREYDVRFPEDKFLVGDWGVASVRSNLQALLADDEVDVVVTLGVLGSNEAGRLRNFSKPVFAPYVLFPRLQGIPYEERRGRQPGIRAESAYHVSGVENLSYVVVGADFQREISKFLEVTPFERLTVLSLEALEQGIPELNGNIAREVEPLGVEVNTIYVADSAEEALERISSDAEAVYVTPMLQLPPGGLERVAQGLIERRLPSFSLWGRSEVERGIMAGLGADWEFQRVARRVALNLHRVLMGESAAELPVDFDRQERLVINMETARAVGARLTWPILTEAEQIDRRRESGDRELSLERVVREAENVNLDLAAADRVVAAGLRQIQEARANLLPQVEISGSEVLIDKDRARASFGATGQSQTSGTAGVTQLIYSEQARAGYRIERELQDSRQQERAELRLDIVLEAAIAYLDVLRAKTAERIQQQNLELTRENLERAESRRNLGAAGPGEVYRWEAQLATNRQEFIFASVRRNQAEIALNRILNRPSEESFLTREAGLQDASLEVQYDLLRPYIDNIVGFRIFREFLARQAIEASPELRQFDAAIRAQQRALLAAKRVFYVPTVAASAEVTGFQNVGTPELSLLPEGSGGAGLPMIDFPTPNNVNWNVAVQASLPLFNGGALRARRSRAEIELDELTVRREAVRLRVEQRVRSSAHQLMGSFAAIDLSRQAAEAARDNLELVADAYSEGAVDILRLLDAQSQALVADLVAANAVFDFLADLLSTQRARGGFDYFRSPAERAEMIEELRRFFAEEGYEPRESPADPNPFGPGEEAQP